MRATSETAGTMLNAPNILIIGVPEEEDKKKGHKKTLEVITVKNFPKWGRKQPPKSKNLRESQTG